MKIICLHGPESTGKSTLAAALAAHFGCALVPEYGRTYCDEHGTDISMAQLVEIAQTHEAMTRAARAQASGWLILDTDPLMTAVWADMMFGARDPWFDHFAGVANFYLLPDIDLPWVDDGLRMYGSAEERARFFALSRAELDRRAVPYTVVGGSGEARVAYALAAINRYFGLPN
jgi:NadR type nicotinamide-nucleotide adenylyltransferase